MNKYDRNISVLESCLPGFATWLATQPDNHEFKLAPTLSDYPDLLFTTGHHQGLLYGVDNPMELARSTSENNLKSKPRIVFLFGLGLGYRAQVIASGLSPGQTMFVVEENPQVVKMALSQTDFSVLVANNTMIFLQPDRPLLQRFAKDLAELYRRNAMSVIVDETCRGYYSSDFIDCIEGFQFTIRSEAGKRNALFKHGGQAVENEIVNLPLTLLAQGIGALKGCLSGIPALVISAGPSLAENVHLLPQVVGHAAVIATAPVLRLLTAYDIRPDLIGILDYTPDNYTVLRDVYGTEDIPLAFLEGTYPRVIREYQGELISVLHTYGSVRKWLTPLLAHHDHLQAGTNVGAFCLQLAIYLGADPIILVGQDLAFPDRTTHSEGVVGRRSIKPQSYTPDQIRLESVTGGKVLSTITMASYLDEFNQIIELNPATYINTSHNGARIRGTMEMSLKKALARYCPRTHRFNNIISKTSTGQTNAISEIAQELHSLEKELKNLEVVVKKALDFAQDIKDLVGRVSGPQESELLKLLKAHSAYTNGAIKYVQAIEPLRQYLAEPLSNMKNNDSCFLPGKNWRETIALNLSRNGALLTSFRQGTTRLGAVVSQARSELEEVTEIVGDSDRNSAGPDFDRAASTWTRLGRLNRAWACRRQALAARPDSTETVMETARLCLQRERPRQAMEILQRLLSEKPELTEIAGLIKEAEATAHHWLTSSENLLSQNDWVGSLINIRKFLAYEPTSRKAREIESLCLEERQKKIESALTRGCLANSNETAPGRATRTDTATEPGAPAPLEEQLEQNDVSCLNGSKECCLP